MLEAILVMGAKYRTFKLLYPWPWHSAASHMLALIEYFASHGFAIFTQTSPNTGTVAKGLPPRRAANMSQKVPRRNVEDETTFQDYARFLLLLESDFRVIVSKPNKWCDVPSVVEPGSIARNGEP